MAESRVRAAHWRVRVRHHGRGIRPVAEFLLVVRRFSRDLITKRMGQSYETDAEFYGADGSVHFADPGKGVGTTDRATCSPWPNHATLAPSKSWATMSNSLQCRDCRRSPTDATRGGPAGSTVIDSRHGRSSRGSPRA